MENSCFNLLGQYLPRNLAQHENSYPSPLEGNDFSLPAWLGCNVTLVGVTAPCGTQNLLFDKALRFKRFIQATALHNRGKIQILPSWSVPRTAEERNSVPCQDAEVDSPGSEALVADLSSLGE